MLGLGLALLVAVAALTAGRHRAVTGHGALGPCGGQAAAGFDGRSLRCTFDDEFTGSALGSAWQTVQTAQIGFHAGPVCFVDSPGTVAVRGGLLLLTASAATGACTPRYAPAVLSGMVTTSGHFAQAYGELSVRARFPDGHGLQPALWLMPEHDTYGPWPDSGEIDIAESFGDPGVAVPHLHYRGLGGVGAAPGAQCPLAPSRDGFHVYTVRWAPDRFEFSYDDRPCFQVAGWVPQPPLVAPAPFDQAFHLNLDLGLGDASTPANLPGPGTPLPATLAVDWVRAWG